MLLADDSGCTRQDSCEKITLMPVKSLSNEPELLRATQGSVAIEKKIKQFAA